MKSRRPNPNPKDPADPQAVRAVALNLLARREHSRLELHHKLTRRGFTAAVVEGVLDELAAEDWLSETRFAEIFAHSRADKGYGPLRIQMELRERGVDAETISAMLDGLEDLWMRKLAELYRKRFAAERPESAQARARQISFLRQRGFTLEQIKALLRDDTL